MPDSPRPVLRRWFDLINVHLLAFVAVSFFLPLLFFQCGNLEVELTGPNLALGTEFKAVTPQRTFRVESRELEDVATHSAQEGAGTGTEPIVLLLLVLAAPASLLFLVAFLRGEERVSRPVTVALLGPLLLLYFWFAFAGFRAEREFERRRDRLQPRPNAEGQVPEKAEFQGWFRIGKTPWFYLGFGCVVISFSLTMMRPFSPVIGPVRRIEP